MKILVLGGTRFFGKLLVEQLIDEGHDVTVATRGLTPDPFGDRVRRVKANRSSFEEMSVFQSEKFDVVYDQLCFNPMEASIACKVFKGRVIQGLPIGIPDSGLRRSFISSDEAADFLCWLKSVYINGPINAASHPILSLQEIIHWIADITDGKPLIVNSDKKDILSPWHKPNHFIMDTSKAQELGFLLGDFKRKFTNIIETILVSNFSKNSLN